VEVVADEFTARSTLWNVGLSRNKSLRVLEFTASSIDNAIKYDLSRFLEHVFSTITSPASLEVMVLYQDYDFIGVWHERMGAEFFGPFCNFSEDRSRKEALRYRKQFEVFCEVQKVQDFHLVLCADVWHRVGEYSVRVLKEAVEREKVKGVFDNFASEPVVIYSPSATHTTKQEELYAGGCQILPAGRGSNHPSVI